MKTSKILFLTLFLSCLSGMFCTKVEYTNLLDKNGLCYIGDTLAADDDSDGVANYFDTGSPYRQGVPIITLTGGGDTVIILQHDPNHIMEGLGATAYDTTWRMDVTNKIVKSGIYFTSQCSTYTITYTVTNVDKIAQKKRVIIVDCEGPQITLNGDNPMNIPLHGQYIEFGATAVDNVDGPMPSSTIIISGIVNTNTTVEHTDTITYTVSDSVGNKTVEKRKVNIYKPINNDTIAPVITLNPPVEMSIVKGTGYVEPGYTVVDDQDTLHDSVKISGSVHTDTLGTYKLTYNVRDKAGNPAVPVTRTIHVNANPTGVDSNPPLIVLKGRNPDTVLVLKPWTEPGYYVEDDRCTTGLGAAVKVTGGPVVTTAATFFRLYYDVKDTAENPASTKMRIVQVVNELPPDKDPPKVTLADNKSKDTVLQGKHYTDAGAIAIDQVDGNLSDKIKKSITDEGSRVVDSNTFTSKIGTYKITYSATDKSSNTGYAYRSVFVKDSTPLPEDFLKTKYGVPLKEPLASINKVFNFTSVDTGNRSAPIPNMKNVVSFKLDWNLANRQLNQFALQLSSGQYQNYTPTQNFSSEGASFTINGTSISKLDGAYYIFADATKCVWVKKDGTYALIFQ